MEEAHSASPAAYVGNGGAPNTLNQSWTQRCLCEQGMHVAWVQARDSSSGGGGGAGDRDRLNVLAEIL